MLRSKTLRPLKLPRLERTKLANGLSVLVAQRGPLPLVSMRLMVRSGSSADPAQRHGLADFTAKLMRRGAGQMDADQINEAVERVGGTLASGASEDAVTLSLSGPAERFDELIDVFGKIACEPTFPPEEVESARNRSLAEIANVLDDPESIADRALVGALWGQHPYGHEVIGHGADLRAFSRADVVAFHRDLMGPRIATLVIVGEIDPSRAMDAAERAFGPWKGGRDIPPALSPIEQATMAGKVLVIEKPEQTQTQIRIAGKGIRRNHPDFLPVWAVNEVLGGSFTSRLMTEIRVKRGLSYGASSSVDALKFDGAFVVSTFTKTERTREALDVALEQIRRMREKGPTAAELDAAKRHVVGLFPAYVETNEGLAASWADIELYERAEDWLEKFRERFAEVTPKQAVEAARTYWFGDDRVIVLVGNAKEIEKQSRGLGDVVSKSVAELE